MSCITTATAREMAAKSHDARRVRLAALSERGEIPQACPSSGAPLSDYVVKRLARVRKQLDRIDAMVMEETDPQKIDQLASALARLSEMERVLDGHPLPGSQRPATERPRRTFSSALPEPT